MHTKYYSFISLLLLLLAVFLVKTKLETISQNSDSIVQSAVLPLEFQEFYDHFHIDSTYQIEHIQFPLQGMISDDAGENHEHNWNQRQWKIHKPINTMNGTFEIEFHLITENLIEERVLAKTLNFNMIRRFAKLDQDYYLIYYKNMGPA